MTKSIGARVAVLTFAGMALASCANGPLGSSPPDTFELSAPTVEHAPHHDRRQLLVPTPTALKALASNQVVVHTSPTAIQYLADSQWSDSLPDIVQAKLIQAYEGTGRLGGVGRPGDGLAIDDRVLIDIRDFSVSTVGAPVANVDLSVRILNDRTGVVRAQKSFRASAPVGGDGNDAFIAALNAAFDQTVRQIVVWTLDIV